MFNNSPIKQTIVLLIMLVALVLAPLVIQTDEETGGTVADSLDNSQNPWMQPEAFWDGGEIGSLVFGLQMAAGAGILFYYFGYIHGRRKERKERAGSVKATDI